MSSVEWADKARDELADIYVRATTADRNRIEIAVLAIESDLRSDARTVGESRAGGLRFEIRAPLGFWFSVLPDGSRARIVRVTRSGRK